jgi:hypothetical protein
MSDPIAEACNTSFIVATGSGACDKRRRAVAFPQVKPHADADGMDNSA